MATSDLIDSLNGIENLNNGIIDALGSTGFGLWDSFINGLFGNRKKNQEQERAWNYWTSQVDFATQRQWWTMDKANNFAVDMWNRTNAYNSPVEQRNRMEQAGLNPNWSNGIGGEASTVSSSNPSAPSASGLDIGALIQSQLAKQQMSLQKSLAEKQLKINDKLANSEIRNKDLQSDAQETENKRLEEKLDLIIDGLRLGNDLTQSNIDLADSQTDLNGVIESLYYKQVSWFDKKAQAEVNNLIANTKKLTAESKSILKKLPYEVQALIAKALLDKKTAEYVPYRAESERMEAQAAQTNASANVMRANNEKEYNDYMRTYNEEMKPFEQILKYYLGKSYSADANYKNGQKAYYDTLKSWQEYYNQVMRHNNLFQKSFELEMKKVQSEIDKIDNDSNLSWWQKIQKVKEVFMNRSVSFGPFSVSH